MTRTKPSKIKQLELEVLRCKAQGLTVRETAQHLGIGQKRVLNRLDFINKVTRDNLVSNLVNNVMPVEYATQLELNRLIIQKAMKLADESHDKRVSLEGLRLISMISESNQQILVNSYKIGKAIQQEELRILPLDKQKRPLDNQPINIIEEVAEGETSV